MSVDAYQIIANMVHALDLVAADDLTCAAAALGIPSRQRGVAGPVIIAHLTKLNVKTLRGMWTQTCRLAGGTRSAKTLASGSLSETLASGSSEIPLLPPVLPVVNTIGAREAESDSDTDLDLDQAVESPSWLEQWQGYPQL